MSPQNGLRTKHVHLREEDHTKSESLSKNVYLCANTTLISFEVLKVVDLEEYVPNSSSGLYATIILIAGKNSSIFKAVVKMR